ELPTMTAEVTLSGFRGYSGYFFVLLSLSNWQQLKLQERHGHQHPSQHEKYSVLQELRTLL
ncbi:hypothetical protein, partial [Salmonella enterica]|uniref:hypothetical protein n=1 Tax=Salmonella enterica TaxID=28901 RepID=UPI003CF993BB